MLPPAGASSSCFFSPLGLHAESLRLGRFCQIFRELSGNIRLLHREAWEGNSLYPANRQMQWDSFRKLTNHAEVQMELFTLVPSFLLFSCLLPLCPILLQEGFWIVLSATFQGNCNRCRLQANSVFSWSASVRCINWVFWLYIFKACVELTAMVPLLFELVTLCLRKVVSLLHFICLWELKCCVLVSDFFLPIHLALLSFLITVIRKPAVTSNHYSHKQPDTLSPLEGATKPFKWFGFSHLAYFTCSQIDLH